MILYCDIQLHSAILLSMCNFSYCSPSSSLYCNYHYMFQPNWPSSCVQVVCIRKLLLCFSIVIALGPFVYLCHAVAMKMFSISAISDRLQHNFIYGSHLYLIYLCIIWCYLWFCWFVDFSLALLAEVLNVFLAFDIFYLSTSNFSWCFLFSLLQIFKYTTHFGPTGHLQVYKLVYSLLT
jgi:hypothetical protein